MPRTRRLGASSPPPRRMTFPHWSTRRTIPARGTRLGAPTQVQCSPARSGRSTGACARSPAAPRASSSTRNPAGVGSSPPARSARPPPFTSLRARSVSSRVLRTPRGGEPRGRVICAGRAHVRQARADERERLRDTRHEWRASLGRHQRQLNRELHVTIDLPFPGIVTLDKLTAPFPTARSSAPSGFLKYRVPAAPSKIVGSLSFTLSR